MAILVRNIKLGLDEPEERLVDGVAKRLNVPPSAIRTYAPVRRSLDARIHTDVHFVYHVEVALNESEREERARVKRLGSPHVVIIRPHPPDEPTPGQAPLREQPVIVGFGPAGMFAALRLVRFGYHPIVLERGMDVKRRHRDVLQTFYRDRVFNPQSNLLFGEGGAGTYSDGKLFTRISDPLVQTVLECFYQHGAPPEVLTDARPHIGSDRLPTVCRRIRQHIEREGGTIRFNAQLQDLTIADGAVTSIVVNGERQRVGPVILATGHSARDTMRMLHRRGLHLEPRPFQIGVRIEHPQELVDHWQFGPMVGHNKIPPAEYRVVAKSAGGPGRDCYSFCMCPGGVILPTNESEGLIATNGASNAKRNNPFANSGLVITFPPRSDGGDPLAGVAFQRKWEEAAFHATGQTYRVPAQRAPDFLAGRPSQGTLTTSYPLGGQWTDIRDIVPPEVVRAIEQTLPILDRRMPGFAGAEALITAPETRVSSPVRLIRDAERRTAQGIDNLYPAGEGAGYAGGIVSAAIDGIRTADAIIRRYAPNT